MEVAIGDLGISDHGKPGTKILIWILSRIDNVSFYELQRGYCESHYPYFSGNSVGLDRNREICWSSYCNGSCCLFGPMGTPGPSYPRTATDRIQTAGICDGAKTWMVGENNFSQNLPLHYWGNYTGIDSASRHWKQPYGRLPNSVKKNDWRL